MIGFVSPTTTPLRGRRLFVYYNEYMTKVKRYLASSERFSAMAPYAGDRCNVGKTVKLLELWKFFKSLEDTPPQGKDYVATEAELWAKLKEAIALTDDLGKKICRVCTELFFNSSINHALRCVPEATTDQFGNDGRCQVIPESEDVTYSWAKSFLKYRNHVKNIADKSKERNYRRDIYVPDLECDRTLGPPPGSEGAAPSPDSDVLEGGYCPPDRGCYEDYGQDLDIYDHAECKLKDEKPILFRNCQNLNESRGYWRCEYYQLDKIFEEELETLSSSSYSGLKRGDACKHDFEAKLRYWLKTIRLQSVSSIKGNKYQWLIDIYNFKNGIGGTVRKLCDRAKLLKCSQSGTCECLTNTKQREVNLEGGVTVFSDYCYFTSGNCDEETEESILDESNRVERKEIYRHYRARRGESGSSCRASNWCVFTKKEQDFFGQETDREVCTTENTGNTGHNGEGRTTTTTTTTTTTARTRSTTVRRTTTARRRTTTDKDESNLVCVGNNCGWQDAGEAQKEIHVMLKILVVIKMLTVCV